MSKRKQHFWKVTIEEEKCSFFPSGYFRSATVSELKSSSHLEILMNIYIYIYNFQQQTTISYFSPTNLLWNEINNSGLCYRYSLSPLKRRYRLSQEWFFGNFCIKQISWIFLFSLALIFCCHLQSVISICISVWWQQNVWFSKKKKKRRVKIISPTLLPYSLQWPYLGCLC